MIKEQYIVICRYEHMTTEGKQFTKWFVEDGTPRELDDAKQKIKKLKSDCKDIDNKTKLKHEYDVKLYSEHLKELEDIKNRASEAARKYEEYKKSDEYKAIQKRKRQQAKEAKERQKRYAELHPEK